MHIIDYLLENDMKLVCEACSKSQLDEIIEFASVVQIGARNMQNFELLKVIGKRYNFKDSNKKVLLKRGFANTVHEWLSSAKYLEQSGVPGDQIILCERGSRHHASPNGVVLDLALAYKVKMETKYEVMIDPSHGTRETGLVLPLAKAAMAMGFDGLMIEAHPFPAKSVSDPQQAVTPHALEQFFEECVQRQLLTLESTEVINFKERMQRPTNDQAKTLQ